MVRIQRLVPSAGLLDDALGIGGPDEGLGGLVVLLEVAVDGRLQGDDGVEDATPEPPAGEGGEERLDGVEPSTVSRRSIRSAKPAGPGGPEGSRRWE